MTKARPSGLPLLWRVVIFGVLPAGFVVLLGLGLYGDNKGFWTTRPYATNILTTATGACLGIPLAVGIIQRLTAAQEESSQYRVTARILNDNLQQIETAICGTYNGSLADIEAFSIFLRYCGNRILNLVSTISYPFPPNQPRPTGSNAFIAELERFRSELDELSIEADKITIDHDAARALAAMYWSAWESLEGYIRPRLHDINGRWISTASYLKLRQQRGYSPIDNSELQRAINEIHQIIIRWTTSRQTDIYADSTRWHHSIMGASNSLEEYLVIRRELPSILELRGNL